MNISKNHKNKYLIICTGLLLSFSSFAQDAAQPVSDARKGFLQVFDWDITTWLLIFIFVIMAISISALYSSLKALTGKYSVADKTAEIKPTVKEESEDEKESFWTRFDKKFLTRAVPVEREADVMLDNNYDGIRELDNSLPPWWKWGFVFTIVFAVVYLLSYHVAGTGKLQLAEYQDELTVAELAKAERMKLTGENVNEGNVKVLAEPEAIAAGKDIFTRNCVACHLADGGGQVGPNLTDQFWIHGGGIKNIFTTITNGVPAKGMISWKTQLTPKQIQQVASYILTFQGTTPAVAKEPQGDKWTEAAVPVDSTAVSSADSTVKN